MAFLERSYNSSPSSFHQPPQQAPIVQPANVLNASNSVIGSNSNVPPNPSSQVAEDIPSNISCAQVDYCVDVNSSSQASDQPRKKGTIDRTSNRADVKSSQPPRQRNRAGAIGPTTYRRARQRNGAEAIGPTTYRRADSPSSESSAGSSRDTTTQSSSESEGGLDRSLEHYLPLERLEKIEERRLRMSSLSFHSSSSATLRAMSSLSFHSSSTTYNDTGRDS